MNRSHSSVKTKGIAHILFNIACVNHTAYQQKSNWMDKLISAVFHSNYCSTSWCHCSGSVVMVFSCLPESHRFNLVARVAFRWRENARGPCTVRWECKLKKPGRPKLSKAFHYSASHSPSRFKTFTLCKYTYILATATWKPAVVYSYKLQIASMTRISQTSSQ